MNILNLYINTQKIDRITGEWLYIYNELIVQEDKKSGYRTMIGGKDFEGYNSLVGNQGGTYLVPLNFGLPRILGVLCHILHYNIVI